MRALEACGGRVKPAVLVLKGLSASEAAEMLARSGGNLRAELAGLGLEAGGEGRVRSVRSRAKQS